MNLRDVEDKIESAKTQIDGNKHEIAFDAIDCLKFLEVNSELERKKYLRIIDESSNFFKTEFYHKENNHIAY